MSYTVHFQKSSNPAKIVYIPHGGGPFPLLGDPRHSHLIHFLKELPSLLIQPSVILIVSAHWEEMIPTVNCSELHSLYYDYSGFPEETYDLSYPASGNLAIATKIGKQLENNGFLSGQTNSRGLDHGVFVPMLLMYPEATIPLVQLSILNSLDPASHIKMGRAIQEIKKENVLIIGSGSSFHNLPAFRAMNTPEATASNIAFEGWLRDTLTSSSIDEEKRTELMSNWDQVVGARFCHPREEHLLPLHVCYGLAGKGADQVIDVEFMEMKTSAYLWE